MFHVDEHKWQENRDKLARLEQQQADGLPVSDARLGEARRQVESDEATRLHIEQAIAARQAAADAQRQTFAQRQAEQGQQDQERYKQVARSQWPGDQASFDAAWPRLLQDWQIRQTAESAARLAANMPRITL